MRATGQAFTVAGRLVVPLAALRAWERREQARERGEWEQPTPPGTRRRRTPRETADHAPGWWSE